MIPTEILEEIYKKALKYEGDKLSAELIENIKTLISKIDKNKSLVSAIITSIIKKIISPKQDIRLHRTDFKFGYSARVLDTNVTTPFLKKYFPKYANKESSFLTLSIREKIKWTTREGQNLKIRDKNVKRSFLGLLEVIENNLASPEEILIRIFSELINLQNQQSLIFDETIESADFTDVINITQIIKMLEDHFTNKLGSRLPVIAIYTVYQDLIKVIKRYDNKILGTLNVHTSSDKHGYGDIELWNEDLSPFEMVEIKHNIEINRNIIFDIVKKCENTSIKRYYILTTAKNNFTSPEEENFIAKFILKMKKDKGIEIIANGIIQSLKYYLRFIEDYRLFLLRYTHNLIEDAKVSTEVRAYHITNWKLILSKYKIQ